MSFPALPEYVNDQKELNRKTIAAVNNIMQGRTNNTGTVTLTASSATTTITFAQGRLGQDTVISLTPTTSNGAGALSGLYVSSRNVSAGTLILTHANTAATDKSFSYVLTG